MINYKNTSVLKFAMVMAFSILVLNAHSQKVKTYFISNNAIRCLKSNAKYKRTVYKQGKKWVVRDYYLNDSLQMTGYYLNRGLTIKTDTFTYYYLNGKISDIYVYKDGHKNGNAKSYYLTGGISRSANYNMGKMSGTWIWYNKDGSIGLKLDNVTRDTYRKYFRSAEYVGGKMKLNEYLKKIEYPYEDISQLTYGEILTMFTINKKGFVSDVDIIIHGTKRMDSIVKMHLYNMPKWNPALINGKPVSSTMVLPVQFVLDGDKVKLSDDFIGNAFFIGAAKDYKQKKYEKAIFKVKQAIAKNNREAKYYYLLGYCYYDLKKMDLACANWVIANNLDSKILKKEIKDFCKLNKK